MQSERLRRSWLTPVRRAVIARQLAEGLAFLHGLPGTRVIHRDLKPNNVLLEAAPSLGVKASYHIPYAVPMGIERCLPCCGRAIPL